MASISIRGVGDVGAMRGVGGVCVNEIVVRWRQWHTYPHHLAQQNTPQSRSARRHARGRTRLPWHRQGNSQGNHHTHATVILKLCLVPITKKKARHTIGFRF